MKVSKQNILKIKLKGKEATHLKSVLKEILYPKIGFNKASITTDEIETLNKLYEQLKQ